MTWPEAGALTYGETLRESVLTGGDQQGKGTYAWKTPEVIPTVENTGCTGGIYPERPQLCPGGAHRFCGGGSQGADHCGRHCPEPGL